MDMEKAVGAYLSLRDKIDVLKKVHKAEIAEIQEKQDKLANLMDKAMKPMGEGASIKTPIGTVFRAKKDSVKIENKTEFAEFVLDCIKQDGIDGLGILTLSANKNAVKEFMEDHDDDLPPGVKYEQWLEVQVRRS